jgi:predicted CoA-binding protein
MTDMEPIPYSDDMLRSILQSVKTIAVVGASANPSRASHYVMKFLQDRGYRAIPVNPGLEGQVMLGERVYADLKSIPVPVDMVEVFRASDAAGEVTDEAIAIGAKVVWMQLGVRDDAAAARAQAAGLQVVMDRCPKIEIPRLGD